jgi:hypothetical protein
MGVILVEQCWEILNFGLKRVIVCSVFKPFRNGVMGGEFQIAAAGGALTNDATTMSVFFIVAAPRLRVQMLELCANGRANHSLSARMSTDSTGRAMSVILTRHNCSAPVIVGVTFYL